MSNLAKILLAVNAALLALLADPTVAAIVAAHPKVAVIVAVISNIGHLFTTQKS